MTWAAADHQPKRDEREPKLELLHWFWRVVGPSGRPVRCGLFRTDAGLEVRADRGEDLNGARPSRSSAASKTCRRS